MSRRFLLIDTSALAYRAWHTTGGLSHGGVETGVAFGVFREVLKLEAEFVIRRIVWCFDGGCECRRAVSPEYKVARPGDGADREAVAGQIKELYRRWLPAVGFRNLLRRRGFEADDVIAAVVGGLPPADEAVIVSGDHDLWQLLRPGVSVYAPVKGRLTTDESFRAEWGLEPRDWAKVLAIAGCPGDGVRGIDGVGEKSAAQWLAGRLDPKGKRWAAIRDGWQRIGANDRLVRLPFPGVGRFDLADDADVVDWRPVLKELGMRSLLEGF